MIDQNLINARDNCKLSNDKFSEYFIKDLDLAKNLFGSLDEAHNQDGLLEYTTLEIATLVGSHAMKLIEDSGIRRWMESAEISEAIWQRMIWKHCLCVSVGYVISNFHIQTSDESTSWNPGIKDAIDLGKSSYSKIVIGKSNRLLDPKSFSLAAYIRIYKDSFAHATPMMSQAIIDAFDSKGPRDNPIRHAFKRAVKKSLYELKKNKMPRWWVDCIHDYGIIEEMELEQDIDSGHLMSAEINVPERKGQNNNEQNTAETTEAVSNNGNDINTNTTGLINKLAEIASSDKVNQKGCCFVKVDDKLFVKYPFIKNKIVEQSPELENEINEIYNHIELNEDGEPFLFDVAPNGTSIGYKMTLAKINDNDARFVKVLNNNENNLDLRAL